MDFLANEKYYHEFVTHEFGSGEPADADTTPVATANKNGVDDSGFVLTVTKVSTGRYSISGNVPSYYSEGDIVSISVYAVVNSVIGNVVVDSFKVLPPAVTAPSIIQNSGTRTAVASSTMLDVINRALRLLSVSATGEAPDSQTAIDASKVLKGILDQWQNEKLMSYAMTNTLYNAITGQQTYSIGPMTAVTPSTTAAGAGQCQTPAITPVSGTYVDQQDVTIVSGGTLFTYYTLDGSVPTTASTLYTVPIDLDTLKTAAYLGSDGLYTVVLKVKSFDVQYNILTPSNVATTTLVFPDWVGNRPNHIEAMFTRDTTLGYYQDYPIQMMPNTKWQDIYQKQIQSTYPLWCWYDMQYPIGFINLWPIPITNISCNISQWLQLCDVTTLTTAIEFPPGYQMALEYALAYHLAGEYGQSGDKFEKYMLDAKANIKRLNTENILLKMDPYLSDSRPRVGMNIFNGF
jgi:hypothetical protein